MHHSPTRRVINGTGLELMTCQPRPDTLTTRLPRPHQKFKRPPVTVVWWLGEGMPAQVSSSSLDDGSELRGPSPNALE
ncbi:hypothetical protein TNCV_4851401 [Trichonephila clavipes]|nr:hypothetical protein TNCV_4851401 [Trichonephila clavipes]